MANKNFVVRHGLEVSGNAGVAGNLGVSGTLSVGGDIQTTSLSITNGAQVGGALTVTGVTDLNSSLQVSGNTSLTGTLQVNGNTSLTGTLQVNGNTSLASNLDVGATLCVAGNTNIVGVTTIGGKLNINNDISSSGNGQFQSVLSGGQLRTASFRSTGTLTVNGASYLSGSVQAKGTLSVGGRLTAGGDIQTTSLSITNGAQVGGALTVTGVTDLNGDSSVCGQLQVTGVLSGGQLRATSSNVAGTLTVQGASYLSGSVQAKGVLSGLQLRCSSLRVTGGTAAICGSMDICGSLQVGGFVSANTYNFEMFGAVPAYSNSDYSTINWSIANSAIQLRSSTDTTIGMAFPAFRVNSATNVLGRWRITIQVKASAAATSGLYVRVYEYDGELPAGKVAVSNDASNAVVQEDTRQGVTTGTVENVAIGTDWVTKTFYYTPTATAVYASIVVLNWTGIGTNHLYVRPPVIQPEYSGFVSATTMRTSSFRSTGALTVLGGSYLSGTVQAKGVLSGLQLRCASLRVTGGTAAICGSMDICGSLQVAAVLSAGQFRGTSNNLQRGNISSMTFGGLNGGYVSATTIRCASLRVTGSGTNPAAICGSMDVSGSLQVAGTLSGTNLKFTSAGGQRDTVSLRGATAVATFDKIRLWTDSNYTIGMTQGLTFGGLGSDYAMTFTMNNDVSRGFLWRHNSMTSAQGAMSLTTAGQLTIAAGVRIGFGQGDTTAPASNGMQVNGTISCDAIHAGASNIETTGIISGSQLRCTSFFMGGNGQAVIWGQLDVSGVIMGRQLRMTSVNVQGAASLAGGLTVNGVTDINDLLQVQGIISCQGLHAAASAIQTTSIISGTTMRCASLRVTGSGTNSICGGLDISGSVQVLNTLSAATMNCVSLKVNKRITVSNAIGGDSIGILAVATGSGFHYPLFPYATATTYQGTLTRMQTVRSNSICFKFLECRSNNYTDTDFRMHGDGNAYADGSWSGGGADYAEFFEWKDGNPNNEPRFGQPVYLISGEKIALATSGNIPIGVISKNPVVTGGSAWNKWEQKYLRDEWNAYIRNEDGDRILNPDFDPDREYVPREERSEWDAVGLMGKLPIQKEYITDTIRNNTNWLKMSDVNDNVERWLVK